MEISIFSDAARDNRILIDQAEAVSANVSKK